MRSPRATRPWQHVLEPVSAYLWLAASLLRGAAGVKGESFNFGPSRGRGNTVEELISEFVRWWPGARWQVKTSADPAKKEHGLLHLDCSKAASRLKWKTALSFGETAKMTADWYKAYYDKTADMRGLSARQIEEYVKTARRGGMSWAR